MRNRKFFWIVLLLLAGIQTYVFSALQTLLVHHGHVAKMAVTAIFWVLNVSALLVLAAFPYVRAFQKSVVFRNYVFAVVMGVFLGELAASAIFLVDDLRRGIAWVLPHDHAVVLPRYLLLTWLGVGLGGSLFLTLLLGFGNKYKYQVRRVKLFFGNLPAAFKGLKIVQISDIHSGSLQNKAAVAKGVDMILAEKPDLILFTGDLVNDHADELDKYTDVFGRLTAPMGVYSVLGNHDYGDYYAWPDKDDAHRAAEQAAGRHLFTPLQQQSINKLKQLQAQMGWTLLMNEHVALERNGEKIALLGIENWGGKGNFARYGRMDLAYAGTEHYPFKILMSHDPSHWDVEVKPKYPGIDLALAGHTHGMQFGIELPRIKFSPVQWMYKNWAGLYEHGVQKLYVNRGFGFIGYPGRVGILPEITVIELG